MMFFRSLYELKSRRVFLVSFSLSSVIVLLLMFFILYRYGFPPLEAAQVKVTKDIIVVLGFFVMLLISLMGFLLMVRFIGSLETLAKQIAGKTAQLLEEETDDAEENEVNVLNRNFDKLCSSMQEKMQLINEYSGKLIAANDKLAELITTDELTKLFNKRYFYPRLLEEAARADRYHHPLSAIILDVDNFKHYNDTYGHVFGDQLLQGIGQLIKNNVREIDLPFRYGGDEFSIILPDCDISAAQNVAIRLSRAVATHHFEKADKTFLDDITISCGVTSYHEGNLEDFVKRADQLLYQAKSEGRSKVISSE
jgi:diguanylate cyclase (GGDEF)-like protein